MNRTHNGISPRAAEAFLAAKDFAHDVKCQLINEVNTTAYGEPQAFVELSSGRTIEVTLEQEGLEESEYFFSVRLHCNSAEYDNGYFHNTTGVIDQFNSSGHSYNEIDDLIKSALASHAKHPVPDSCVLTQDMDQDRPIKESLSQQISSASSRAGKPNNPDTKDRTNLYEH